MNILLPIVVLMFPNAIRSDNKSDVLNTCLNSILHKSRPGPENSLYKQCSPWKDRSCCTTNTSKSVHEPDHHNFNFDHCGILSEKCRSHFIQDLCFFECSPNVGLWLVNVDMKIRKQRFYKVPLCKQDCDSWYHDCMDDLTCLGNWMRGWNWTKEGNKCPKDAECRKIKDVFGNATNFCEQVWDDSYDVIEGKKPCMQLWFNGSEGNPNDAIASYYYYLNNTNDSARLSISSSFVIIFLILLYFVDE